MEQIVRVRRNLPDGRAEVFIVRESACSGDCHKCSGCGAAKETVIVEAENPIGAQTGDFVTLVTDSGQILGMAMVVYLLPLVLFFAGFALGAWLGLHEVLMACAGFVLGVVNIVFIDRRIQKKNSTVYTIKSYAPGQGRAAGTGEHKHG